MDKPLHNVVKERVTTPFTGTFILSWLLINWRVPTAFVYPGEENHRAIVEYVADLYPKTPSTIGA